MSSPTRSRVPRPRPVPARAALSVWVEPYDEAWVLVVLTGEVDLSSVPELTQVLAESGSTRTFVDVSGVTFMDCAGLGVLADAASAASAAGGSLRLVGTTGRLRRLIAMTGLEARLPSYDSTTLAAPQ